MKQRRQTTHAIDFLFTITLLAFFAISALLAVVIGARVYERITENMSINYDSRTSIAYVTEKIRQHDTAGAVSIETMDDIVCLTFSQKDGTESYTTYIYAYNGALMELFSNDSAGFMPESGQEILKIRDFNVSLAMPGLYRIQITDSRGQVAQIYVSTRSEEDARS